MPRMRKLGRGIKVSLAATAVIGLAGATSVFLLGEQHASAAPVTLSFDEFTDSADLPNDHYATSGVIFSGPGGSQAFVYSSGDPSVLDNPDGGPFSTPSMLCGGNPAEVGLHAQFVTPGTSTPATASSVTVNVSSGPGPDLLSANVALIAYDASGNVIATDPANTTLQFDTLSVSAPGIARVEMPAGPELDCYDDFSFNLEISDTDGDGVPNSTDNCPSVAGDPAYQGCPVKKFDISYMTFIPSNYVDSSIFSRHLPIPIPGTILSGAVCSDTISDTLYSLIYHGDDRGFSAAAAVSGEYRTLQTGTVVFIDKGTTTDVAMENRQATPGISKSYVRSHALNHGTIGRIDPSDNDGELNDCYLQHGEARGTGELMPQPTVQKLSNTLARVTLTGSAKNGLLTRAPGIDWNFTLDINTVGSSPQVVVSGSRDQFPAYEIYVNNHPVYRFAPDGLQANQIPITRFGLLEMLQLSNRVPVTPVQTILPQ